MDNKGKISLLHNLNNSQICSGRIIDELDASFQEERLREIQNTRKTSFLDFFKKRNKNKVEKYHQV